MLVLTTGNGGNGFTLDQDIGEFILTHLNMTIPTDTREFAINASKMRAKGLEGKLRLLYEANPMSMIIEQAGGGSIAGCERILEIRPKSLNQRVPVILGSRNEVERIMRYYGKFDADLEAA